MGNKEKILYAVKKGKHYLPEEYGWDYCIENKIPQILVEPEGEFATISFDLKSIDFGLTFPREQPFSNRFSEYYDNYCDDTKLPDSKYSYIGGAKHGVITIWSDHVQMVIDELVSQIDNHVNEYGKIDQLLKEHTETLTRMNKMMNSSDYSVPWDEDEYDRLEEKLAVLVRKMGDRNAS